MTAQLLQVAVPTPLRRLFDYAPPAGLSPRDCPIGARVLVPFAGRELVGVVTGHPASTDIPSHKLKAAKALLDNQPLLPADLLQLCQWAANYYHHPVGEAVATALPTLLRQGEPLPVAESCWQVVAAAPKGLRGKALELLTQMQAAATLPWSYWREQGFAKAQLNRLLELGLIAECPAATVAPIRRAALAEPHLPLNDEQQAALDAIELTGFNSYLLEGVTGSGKTEVYLQLLEKVLNAGKQALVLIPEIGLTPQTAKRFSQRFAVPVALLHSGLNDRERLLSFQAAASSQARIVIGTRSSLFTPLPELGLIIVDEEHDSSYKQQDHFRYSARDLAVYRGHLRGVPVVLGSATPSLETLHNALSGRYQHLQLTERAGNAAKPVIEVIDLQQKALHEGLTEELLQAMRAELAAGNQVLVFLNRRGYAPALLCDDCCWQADCWACSAKLTVHRHAKQLKCHHCDAQQPLPTHCPECQSTRLRFSGVGTQRSEAFLEQQFAEYPVIRIDRDSMSQKQAFADTLQTIQQGAPCILVGTQMLAKGHHFPDVTLVCMLDIDNSLFSADFRAPEKMGQLIEQVAGRAGRAAKSGKVLIQTRFGGHPLLQTLLQQGYGALAKHLLNERHGAKLPPFCYSAILRAEHTDSYRAQQTLTQWLAAARAENDGLPVQMVGPWPAAMERRNQYYRFDVELQSPTRAALNQRMQRLIAIIEQQPLPQGLRWSLDVDPTGN